MFKTYILYSEIRSKFYIGFTGDDLEERLRKHNAQHKGFTGHVDDWQIVYFESFEVKILAMQREKEIKNRKSRKKIEQLINK